MASNHSAPHKSTFALNKLSVKSGKEIRIGEGGAHCPEPDLSPCG